MGLPRFILALTAAALCLVADWSRPVARAGAQGSTAEKAAAEALFDAGLSLMREGKFDEACAKLEESQAVESGIGTQLYLAECYTKVGRTASAWALFREAASAAAARGQQGRAAAGRKRAEELAPRLSKVVVLLPEGAAELPELNVMAGVLTVPVELWGLPVPFDPGELEVRVSAKGYEPWTGRFVVPGGPSTVSIQVPALTPAPPAVAEAPMPAPQEVVEPSSISPQPVPPPDSDPGADMRLAGYITGGVGVAAVGVGVIFGVRALVKAGDAEDAGCDHGTCPTQAGITATDQGLTAARISTGFVAGGLVAVAASAVLIYLASDESDMALQVSPALALDGHSGGVLLGGTF